MWPFDARARDVLRLPNQTQIAWAVFDPDWYRATYHGVLAALRDQPDDAILGYYLDRGQALGHSPNRYFDETWHRRTYAGIAHAVERGAFESAFDAYCRTGNADRAPHWLFDELLYRRRYPDLTNDVLVAAGLANGYDHFLRHGNKEGRIGHPLFDPLLYLSQLDPEERAAAAEGPFQHYLHGLDRRAPDRTTSVYFDPAWYVQRYPAVTSAIAAGLWRSALEHYVCNDTPTAFDPLPDFSEDWYLTHHPGLREVIEAGDQRNGYVHFLRHGTIELRSPAPHIDLKWYAAREDVRDSLARGDQPDAFTHWIKIGRPSQRPAAPVPEEQITAAQARSFFRATAEALLPLYGRAPLRFGGENPPTLSVVLAARGDLAATLATLASLRGNTTAEVELIVLLLGPSDVSDLGRFVSGATMQRLDADIDAAAACDAGLACARAEAVLWIQPGIEFAPGTIDAALRRLGSDPLIAAVGGKILYPHGVLRSAGHVVWNDGTTHAYSRGESPLAPEANFARDTHFCDDIFSLLRRSALAEQDGGGTGTERCLALVEAGYRVVYDPAIIVRDWNETEAPADPIIQRERHAGLLDRCLTPDGLALAVARLADPVPRRVLFIEDTIPLRGLGSGFVRSNDLIAAMAEMGYAVTVYPMNAGRSDLARVYADLPDTAEVMHDRTLSGLGAFLRSRPGYYDVIWIARTHNLDRVRPVLERTWPDAQARPAIVLDTEAVSAVRDAERAALDSEPHDMEGALRAEFAQADICRAIIAVSAGEAALLRDRGFANVQVIGHTRPVRPTPRPFHQRAGMLFAGAIHRMDSPNYDGLCWFVDAVLPIVEQSLGWETRLTIAGYIGPEVSLDRFRGHSRVTLRGAMPDLTPLYAAHRLFVAPTRFAAGAPYKVHEAASFGLPVVATEGLRRQLGWIDGEAILTADASDPAGFAERIVALYRDEALWTRLREAALVRIARENDPVAYRAAIGAALGPVRRTEVTDD